MAKVQDLKGLYVLEGVKGKRFKQEIMIPYNYNQGHNLSPSEGEMSVWVKIIRIVSIVNFSSQTLLLSHNMGRFYALALYTVTITYMFHRFCYDCQTMFQLFSIRLLPWRESS